MRDEATREDERRSPERNEQSRRGLSKRSLPLESAFTTTLETLSDLEPGDEQHNLQRSGYNTHDITHPARGIFVLYPATHT